jgi:hypothetical protein
MQWHALRRFACFCISSIRTSQKLLYDTVRQIRVDVVLSFLWLIVRHCQCIRSYCRWGDAWWMTNWKTFWNEVVVAYSRWTLGFAWWDWGNPREPSIEIGGIPGDVILLVIFCEEFRSWNFSLCSFLHCNITSCHLDLNISLITLISNILHMLCWWGLKSSLM